MYQKGGEGGEGDSRAQFPNRSTTMALGLSAEPSLPLACCRYTAILAKVQLADLEEVLSNHDEHGSAYQSPKQLDNPQAAKL